ncbi:MAG TPA: biotin--[acetyl-CoA-carboxylase] ligase [Vicinamibacterales bacterium]|nr:biotin--[acetyl-CoA-carboxylase] ligase [Vicinamibacterales bacterium]
MNFRADATPDDFTTALAATVTERGVFGARLFYFTETGSTNDLAAAAADRGEAEGTTFVAGAQTAGRGRLGRAWFSPPGAGLYVSTIVRRRSAAPWITLAGGVAVAEGIRAATALPVQIKWPNDVVTAGSFGSRKKIAGILAEASSGTSGVDRVVLGIGINLRSAAYPPEIADRATAIEVELGRPVDAGLVLAQLLARLNGVLEELANAGPPTLFQRWLDLAPSAHGASIHWDAPGGQKRGVTAGLAEDGALLVRTEDGLERILAGEVLWA